MTLDAGDIRGGASAEVVLGWIDLGVVDPGQAAPAGSIDAFVTVLSNSPGEPDSGGTPQVIDWTSPGS